MGFSNCFSSSLFILLLTGCGTASSPVAETAGVATPSTDELRASGVVETSSGLLRGVRSQDTEVTAFKGVPFAAPPTGELRFRAPQAPVPWQGVRSADTFSKSCAQKEQRVYLPWTEEFNPTNDYSEDCLALNIWTGSSLGSESLRPVWVFVHGGAFSGGSGEVPVYDGENLAKRGILVVTVNYRVGPFGFLCHPEIAKEEGQLGCGNYGLLDQIAALQWVRQNISAFGGDPDNVTLGGQSAGAASVHYLSAAPQARGLFHRMIVQSGPWDRRRQTSTQSKAEAQGVRFATSLGVQSVKDLRSLSWQKIVAQAVVSGERFAPVVDGDTVPAQLQQLLDSDSLVDVPLLTGLTADEGSSRSDYGTLGLSAYRDWVRSKYPENAKAVLTEYSATTDAEARARHVELLRDRGLATLLDRRTTRAQAGSSADYGYIFERAIPWPEHPEYRAFHSAELAYVFSNLDKLDRPWLREDRRLAEQVSQYWVNFITRGDPNGAGLPVWSAASETVMHLNLRSSSAMGLEPSKAALLLKPLLFEPRLSKASELRPSPIR